MGFFFSSFDNIIKDTGANISAFELRVVFTRRDQSTCASLPEVMSPSNVKRILRHLLEIQRKKRSVFTNSARRW